MYEGIVVLTIWMKIKSEQTSGIVTDSEPYNLMSQTANNGYSENSNQVVGITTVRI